MKNKTLAFFCKMGVALLLVAGISYFSWAHYKRAQRLAIKPIAVEEKLPAIKYNKELLARFEVLSKKLEPNTEEFLLLGNLSIKNGGDSLSNVQRSRYEIRKKGLDYYCKLGATEVLNTGGLNIAIDHEHKNILLTAQKELPQQQLFAQAKNLLGNLQRERYELINAEKDGQAYLYLQNNLHVSCKEYGIAYHPETLRPTKLLMRFSNFEHPEVAAKDKVVSLEIYECATQSNWEATAGKLTFVRKVGGQWQPIAKYNHYKLYVL